jgi:hypothetical protein
MVNDSLSSAVVASLAPNMNLVGTWMGMSFCFAAVGILIGNRIAGIIINVPLNEFNGGFIFVGSTVMRAAVLRCREMNQNNPGAEA